MVLIEMVSESFGEDGRVLGDLLRGAGVPLPLTALLSDDDPAIQNQALFVIGNLCSDAVDADSSLTKEALLNAGADLVLFGSLEATDEDTLELACASLQNLCHDARWAPSPSNQPSPMAEPAATVAFAPDRGPGPACRAGGRNRPCVSGQCRGSWS